MIDEHDLIKQLGNNRQRFNETQRYDPYAKKEKEILEEIDLELKIASFLKLISPTTYRFIKRKVLEDEWRTTWTIKRFERTLWWM